MRNFETKNAVKDWVNAALKVGILLTEPKFRDTVTARAKDRLDSVTDRVKDRVDHVSDTIASRYEDAVDRLEAAGAALQGRYRPSPVTSLLLGVGIGAGLGILLAPAAGTDTREAIRDTAAEAKDKVVESVSVVRDKFRQSQSRGQSTGTEG